jgi:tetratricopeptide (TPR) repeat protein
MKRPAPTLALVAALCGLPLQPVAADQTDPRLDDLFQLLRATDHPVVLAEIENRIWSIWYEHDDEVGADAMNFGLRSMNLGAYEEALLVFGRLIEDFPDFAEAWNRRATLYYLMGDYQASIADIERTLALEPRHFGALSGLGMVYLQLNNLEKARDAFEAMLEVHPHSPAGQENLRRVMGALRVRFI